jgi:predicted N-acetyltransferase YhbS
MPTEVTMRAVAAADLPDIEALHERAFGAGRFAKTAYRIREGQPPFSPLCRVAFRDGRLAAALRMTPITIDGKSGAQLLGPLAVEPALKGQGIGKALVAMALEDATQAGVRLVVLVGDPAYYERFGFKGVPPGRLALPGPVDPRRLLALELQAGALADTSGDIRGELQATAS